MLLGIDIGTSNLKVGVYSRDGELLAHAQAVTPKGVTGGYENYLPDALWQITAGLIKEVLARSQAEVQALAVASMGEAGLPLDKDGEAAYPIIPWNDPRAEAHMQALEKRLKPAHWYAVTGLRPNPIHSIAKWVWLKETQPEVWARSRTWLSVTGYIRYKLTGELLMEASQAARTMAYDVRKHAWWGEGLELAGIPRTFLPPLVRATDPAGEVTKAAAASTGLRAGTPVFAGGHDHICAALACGAFKADVALDSLGTAEGLTFGLAGAPNPAEAGGFGVGPHVIAGHRYYLGGIYSSGGSVAWVKNLLGLESFDALLELAASAEPGASPLFLAHFYGEAPPFGDSSATGAFMEVRPEHGPAEFARSVLEGVAFEIKRHIETFETLVEDPVSIIRVVGSPAQNPLWLLIRAAILGRPLELTRHADMVTLGAALIAGLGAGVYKTPQEAVDATFRVGEHLEPNPDWQARYAEPFERYKHLSSVLREGRKRLA